MNKSETLATVQRKPMNKAETLATVIITIAAIKTTPPVVTPQIRSTKNTNVNLRAQDNE